MRLGSTAGMEPYEVRCLRCDVSFPVGTRTCVHCGGPTSAAKARSAPATVAPVDPGFGTESVSTYDPGPAPDGSGDLGANDLPGRLEGPFDGDVEEAPPSTMRSILNGLGGLLWVVVIVIYSLAQSCGE